MWRVHQMRSEEQSRSLFLGEAHWRSPQQDSRSCGQQHTVQSTSKKCFRLVGFQFLTTPVSQLL